MKHLPVLFCFVLLLAQEAVAQSTDSVYESSLTGARPIKVITSDARTYKGMAIDITTDYVILDLSDNESIMVNPPYYLRPMGKYYRIDVEYIQVASTKKKKRVLKGALLGGVGGMVAFGTATVAGGDGDDFLAASAIGFVVGTVVGTITALVTIKKWHINGSSVELAAFRDHYF